VLQRIGSPSGGVSGSSARRAREEHARGFLDLGRGREAGPRGVFLGGEVKLQMDGACMAARRRPAGVRPIEDPRENIFAREHNFFS
jgi:hypothetical protein